MARIRSIHPGFFTDEAAVTLSPFARLLLIGIWTECDDQGAFEWKPVTLKMRLLPVDNVDVSELLAELTDGNIIKKYELEGRNYGLVRNFRKYQRPKKPNSVHVIPDEFRTYVGLSGDSGEPEPVKDDSVPQKGEFAPQMEDGGWSSSSVSNETGAPPPTDEQWLFGEGLEILTSRGSTEKQARGMIGKWRKDKFTDAHIRRSLEGARDNGAAEPTAYVTKVLRKPAPRDPTIPAVRREPTDAELRTATQKFKDTGFWLNAYGPRPDMQSTRVPKHIRQEFGL